MRISIALITGLIALGSISATAVAEPPPPEPEALVLKAEAGSTGVPIGTEARGILEGVGGCKFVANGEVVENKLPADIAGNFTSFSFEGSNCGGSPSGENMERFVVSTSNLIDVVGEHMKYHTVSPNCTYKTAIYQGEFAIPGLVEANVTASGERITAESEAGCAATTTVEAKARLFDTHVTPAKVFYAIRKSEK